MNNIVDCTPMIHFHKLIDFLPIPWEVFNAIHRCSGILFRFEVLMSLEPLQTTHYIVFQSLSKHAQCLYRKLPDFNANFHADTLFQLFAFDKISNYRILAITKIQVRSLLPFTASTANCCRVLTRCNINSGICQSDHSCTGHPFSLDNIGGVERQGWYSWATAGLL